MVYRKNIKDISNVGIKDGELYIFFKRVNSTHFSQSFVLESDEYTVCEACGEVLTDDHDHSECVCELVDEFCVAEEIRSSLDNEDTVIEINKGREDNIYISLGK